MTYMTKYAITSLTCGFALVIGGCASLSSKVEKASSRVSDGIVYYMPYRPIKISVEVRDNGLQVASVDNTVETFADLRHRFVLSYDQNFVGKNQLDMSVNTKGLLGTSNASTTSGVKLIAENLAKDVASIVSLSMVPKPKPDDNREECANGRTYSMLVDPLPGDQRIEKNFCQFSFIIQRMSPVRGDDNERADSIRVDDDNSSHSGVFYKQNVPYSVTAIDKNGRATQFIAFSPNQSPISFLPVARTLFSDNHTKITLADGMLTAVEESSDGELVALSELPADILSAYVGAVGTIFKQFGETSDSRLKLATNEQAMALAQAKKQACVAAMSASDPSGKSAADLKTLWDNIKAICS